MFCELSAGLNIISSAASQVHVLQLKMDVNNLPKLPIMPLRFYLYFRGLY